MATTLGHLIGVYTVGAPRVGSLRLSLPSALTGYRSPPVQGLPRPVRSAFRVFVYPLSVFRLRAPFEPFFRLKRSWGSPLQSFTPLKDPYLFRGGLLSCPPPRNLRPPISFGRTARLQPAGLQSLSPFEEPCSPEPLLRAFGNRYSLGVLHL